MHVAVASANVNAENKTCLHLEKAPADKRFIFHKGRFQFWMSDKYTRECIQTLVFLVYGISFFLSIAE